uniref:Putative secreted protein n=1 Tax=Anopheles nuneztovari TaxID=30067 RepID=A0A2M3YW63_9DIPT
MKLQILALVVCVAFVVGNEVDSGAPELPTDLLQPDQAEVDIVEPAFEDPRLLEEAPQGVPDDSVDSEESDESEDDKEVIELLEKLQDRQDELDYLNRYLLGRLAPIHDSVIDNRIRPAILRRPWIPRPWVRRPRIPRVLPRLA